MINRNVLQVRPQLATLQQNMLSQQAKYTTLVQDAKHSQDERLNKAESVLENHATHIETLKAQYDALVKDVTQLAQLLSVVLQTNQQLKDTLESVCNQTNERIENIQQKQQQLAETVMECMGDSGDANTE